MQTSDEHDDTVSAARELGLGVCVCVCGLHRSKQHPFSRRRHSKCSEERAAGSKCSRSELGGRAGRQGGGGVAREPGFDERRVAARPVEVVEHVHSRLQAEQPEAARLVR